MFPPYGAGGVSTHVVDLARGLAEAGHEVTIFSCRRGSKPRADEASYAPPGTSVVFLRDFWRMFLGIGKLVRRGHFDIVHVHSFNALALGLMVRGGPWALVFTFHSNTARYFASTRGWKSKYHPGFLAMELFQYLSIGVPDLIIAVSKSAKQGADGIGLKRVVDIPNAVDTRIWVPNSANEAPESHAILVPRMHVPKAGIDVAIRAMPDILQSIPDAQLLITGDGPLRPWLERQAFEIAPRRIQFLGIVPTERMRELFAQTGLTVIPSVESAGWEETFGIAALEAMASGRPVVVSNVGGLPEVVRDGIDGFVVHPGDPVALAHAVVRVLASPSLAANLAREGRRRAESEFSVGLWTQKVLRAYRQAQESHNRPRARGIQP